MPQITLMSNTKDEELFNVCVYGSLRSGQQNHLRYLSNSLYVREIQVPGMMLSLRSFPGIILHSDVPYLHPSKTFVFYKITYGQIYLVNRDTLAELDFLEGHPEFYERVELECGGLGKYYIYKLQWHKYLKGKQLVVPGGVWLGPNTTVNEVDFGEGTTKPKIINWFNKERVEATKKPHVTVPSNYHQDVWEGGDDEIPFEADESTNPPQETVVGTPLQSKEA